MGRAIHVAQPVTVEALVDVAEFVVEVVVEAVVGRQSELGWHTRGKKGAKAGWLMH